MTEQVSKAGRAGIRKLLLGSSALVVVALGGAQAQPVEEVVVTGTHIRGVAPVGSTLISVGSQDLQKTGATNSSDLLLRVPQVFNAGYSDSTVVGGSRIQGAQGNTSFTRSINLRGIGTQGTLTMFNGQRIASGQTANTTDPDSYPSNLVQRVEVVADGGSATYGSDAIAGTVNMILREPADIFQSTGQITVKKHGTDWMLGQIAGVTWDEASSGIGEGGLIIAYQHAFTDAAAASDYSEFYTDDLTPYVGAVGALPTFGSPGNVLGLGGPAGTTALYAVPAGVGSTQRVTLAQLGTANNPNRLSQWTNTFPLPQIERDTIAGNFKQQLTDGVTFWAHGFHFNRSGFASYGSAVTDQLNISVPGTNPYTPCAPGVPTANGQGLTCPANNTITVRYSFARELGAALRGFEQRSYGATYGFDVELPYEWHAKASGHFSKNYEHAYVSPRVNSTALAQVISGTGKPANVPFFNPFCDNSVAPCNDPITNAYISGQTNVNGNLNWIEEYNAVLDGPLFDLPGGTVRLAVGGTVGRIGLDIKAASTTTQAIGILVFASSVNPHRSVTAGFGELYVPVIGDANALPGIRKLEVTLAGRITDYNDAGKTEDPKIGFNWKPVDEITVHGSWGTSFRAPNLREINSAAGRTIRVLNTVTCGQLTGINLAACPQGAATPLSGYIPIGGNPNVAPETADTWSLGADWTPEFIPGVQLTATYFNIVNKDRIAQIGSDADVVGSANAVGQVYESLIAFNPTYWGARAVVTPPVVEFVPGAVLGQPLTQAQFNTYANNILAIYGGGAVAGATNPLTHITDGRFYNSGTWETSGVDVGVNYDTDTEWGAAHFGLNVSYVNSFKTQVVAGTPTVERANTFGYPPELRGRFEAGLESGAWSGTLYVNYINSYNATAADIPATAAPSYRNIDAWTTLDLSLGYNTGDEIGMPLLRNIQLQAIVNNLFDSDPPFFLNAASAPAILYDPQNANVFGRYFTFRITKEW